MDEIPFNNCNYVSSDSESWMDNDVCPENFSKQLISCEDNILNYTSNYDFVINEAANNPSSLETIVEETSDDLRSESSENVELLSEYNNSLDSWIDSELENCSQSSLKEDDCNNTNQIGNIRTPKSVSDCCVQHSIRETSDNNTEFDSNYISRSNSLVQFENLEKLYEDYCPNITSIIDNNSTSLPNFYSSFGIFSQDSLEIIRSSRNFLQNQLSSNSINSKSNTMNHSVNNNTFRSYSDDDIGFENEPSNTSKTKSKKTKLYKSKKISNENLSEDSGFFSDHAVSKKVSCQFQPYDKEDLFIFNRNFASTNFGNSCQNLTMLSDREPVTKLFQQRNSLNKFNNRNHSNKFSFSLHDTISENCFSGGEENEKSQIETDVLSLDPNETVRTALTPTPIMMPIRSVNSEPNICLKFNKLIENRSDSNHFIDFSDFLIDSTERKTKLNNCCKFSKSVDNIYINYTNLSDKVTNCENLQINMSIVPKTNDLNIDEKNVNNSSSQIPSSTITIINEEKNQQPQIVFNAVNNNDGLPFRLLQNDEHFPIPKTRRNVKSTSNLTEFVFITNTQNEYSSTNSINTTTKSVHFCPVVSQVQLHDDIDHVDNTFSDKDQTIDKDIFSSDLNFGENKRNSCCDIICSTEEKIDGNRTGKHEGLNQHNITVDNKQHTSIDEERIPILLLPINSQQPIRKVSSSQAIENYKLMPVAEIVNERPLRKRFGGFLTRLTSFRFKKRQSQHKQQFQQKYKQNDDSTTMQIRTCGANTYDVVGRRISGDNSRNSDEFLYIPLRNEPIDNKNHNHHNNNHHHHYTENDEKGAKQIKGKPPLPVRIVGACVKKKQQSHENNTDVGYSSPGLLSFSSTLTTTPGSVHHSEIIDRERQQQRQQKHKHFQLSDLDNNANCNISSMDHYAKENYLENGTHVDEDKTHPQILGLIETDLDTDVTVITSNSGTTHVKTRSLMNLDLDQNHLLVRSIDQNDFTNSDRPHKSMEFLLDKDNLKSIEPPENELQKVTNNGDRIMSEHQLRVQRSLQKLTLPEWYKPSQIPSQGFLLRRQYHQQQKHKEHTRSKYKEVSNVENQRNINSHNRTKLNLPDSNNQLYFSRWSTPKLNSSYTSASSPCHSIRSSFSYHYQNRPSNNSMSSNQTFSGFSSSARSSFNERKPYLGWRSQERLNQNNNKIPRTPAERLALSLYPSEKQNELIDTPNQNDIQSSIKEVTSAIVNYCGLPDRRQSQSSNSSLRGSKQFCWLESSFIGSKVNLGVPNNIVDSDNDNLSNLSNNLDEINSKIDFMNDESSMTKTESSSSASTTIPLNVNDTRRSIGSTTLDDIIGSLLGLKTNCSSTNK